jgi:hypothetical protein
LLSTDIRDLQTLQTLLRFKLDRRTPSLRAHVGAHARTLAP